MNNLKNEAESLKQKLNNYYNQIGCKIYLAVISLFSALPVFAENEENDFFDPLNNIPGDTVETPVNPTEQQMAAEQVGNKAMDAGNNVLVSIKTFFENCSHKLQEYGHLLSGHLEKLTGGNPLVTKLIVCLILVLISVVVIVILVLIAKFFVFKKKKTNIFQSHEMAQGEDDEFDDLEDDEEIETENQKNIPPSRNNASAMNNNNDLTVSVSSDEPQNMQEAIRLFLQVTD